MGEIKSSMDKSIADLKSSAEQLNGNMGNITTKFQDLEMRFDVMGVKVDKMEMQSTSIHKYLTNHEIESSAKTLRIQNLPYEKDENLYKLLAELLASVLNLAL